MGPESKNVLESQKLQDCKPPSKGYKSAKQLLVWWNCMPVGPEIPRASPGFCEPRLTLLAASGFVDVAVFESRVFLSSSFDSTPPKKNFYFKIHTWCSAKRESLQNPLCLKGTDHVLKYNVSENSASVHITLSNYLDDICNFSKFCKALDHSKHSHMFPSLEHIHEVLLS